MIQMVFRMVAQCSVFKNGRDSNLFSYRLLTSYPLRDKMPRKSERKAFLETMEQLALLDELFPEDDDTSDDTFDSDASSMSIGSSSESDDDIDDEEHDEDDMDDEF